MLGRAAGSTVPFTVVANAQVTYKTTFGKRKRDVMTDSLKFQGVGVMLPSSERPVVLQSSLDQKSGSGSSSLLVPVLFVGFAAVVLFRNFLSNRNLRKAARFAF